MGDASVDTNFVRVTKSAQSQTGGIWNSEERFKSRYLVLQRVNLFFTAYVQLELGSAGRVPHQRGPLLGR